MNETLAMDLNVARPRASVRITIAAALACVAGAASMSADALPVIPGAEGSGVSTPAGRGGAVHRVTTLNETGPGSLRACVDASGPRTCVFEVSGVIRLSDDLTIRNPFLTIAGQTAPSPGIMLRNAGILVKASDILIQHIRVRPGDDAAGEPYINRDALKIEAASTAPISNIVIDHCSFSWATDEIMSAWQYWNNLSLLNNIFAEPLHESLHPEGPHGFGVLFGPVSGSVTLAGNLMAHQQSRNPMTAATRAAVVNNVVYNWGGSAMDFQNRGLTSMNSVIGNVFIAGPDTDAMNPIGLRADEYRLLSGSRLYLADNTSGANVDDWSMTWTIKGTLNTTSFRSTTPVAWPAGLTTRPTAENVVRDHVLRYAGARPADRDSVDTRIVNSVRTRTGQIVNCVSANGTARCQRNAGGWPTLATNTRPLTLPANHNTVTASGYTNLELWLHRMAAQVEGLNPTPPVAPTLASGN